MTSPWFDSNTKPEEGNPFLPRGLDDGISCVTSVPVVAFRLESKLRKTEKSKWLLNAIYKYFAHLCVFKKKKKTTHVFRHSWIQAISTPSPFYRISGCVYFIEKNPRVTMPSVEHFTNVHALKKNCGLQKFTLINITTFSYRFSWGFC